LKEDANKQFTCSATEDVIDGYTSSSSPFSFDVNCKFYTVICRSNRVRNIFNFAV
jgi:hypothetical protein